MRTLLHYLRAYRKMQDKIMLVWREKPMDYWSYRHMYLGPKFSARTPYNHRTMLDNEIVIEFDNGTPEQNRTNADIATQRMVKDGFGYAKWFSGGKSTHVHVIIDPKECPNIPLLKSCLMRHYCKGLPSPDLRLTSKNHLIRAEYGIHEKSGKYKTLISKSKGYPSISEVPDAVWRFYCQERERTLKRKLTLTTKDLKEHKAIKFLMDSTNVREKIKDGRFRIMFLLTSVLKDSMEPKELEQFIVDWYRYSGGVKMSESKVRSNVTYILEKGYNVNEQTIVNYCEEIGLDMTKMNGTLVESDTL